MRKKSKKASTSSKKVAKVDNQVPFKVFFSRCVNLGKLKAHQEGELRAFFRSKDLKDKEDLDTYQKMLESFK